ncbi:MAG: FKBP-type peptidyl-prolyl cis-trans isomerase [Candidatus Sungbacteria bacterium]|nr:FKBP-type peptidyl-prolyl cis-trans isomerase [Candidatus Sungbacteria bacterium]
MEGDKVSFVIALIIIIAIAALGYWYLSRVPEIPNIAAPTPPAPAPAPAPTPVPQPSGGVTPPPANSSQIQVTILKEGAGEGAKKGDTITVNYTGMFLDGKVFDSSIPRGQPFVFNLGAGDVIQGWDAGLVGMKLGEKRKLVIPPELAYGSRGAGDGAIPPNSTLVFEVEMLKIN